MEIEYTPEQIAKSVSATYDVIDNIIKPLNGKIDITTEELELFDRYVEHIRTMMGKEWFVAALTKEQKTELQAI